MQKTKNVFLFILIISMLFFSGVGIYTLWNKLYAGQLTNTKNVNNNNKSSKIAFSNYSRDEQVNISVYKKVNHSVVNITSQIISYTLMFEPFLSEGATGSGSIIDIEGHILTNMHVIQAALENRGKLYITLWDKSRHKAKLIGFDRENDIALIKIDVKNQKLHPIELGNSDLIEVGQKVLAIGNPFGFKGTLTTGIISSLGRTIKNDRTKTYMEKIIQTDAAINPGNSGGPLLNSEGQLIGVNTAIYSPVKVNIGIGFAISINVVKQILSDLKNYGRILRPKLKTIGLKHETYYFINQIEGLSKAMELPFDGGIMIVDVQKVTPIGKLGLKGCNKYVLYGYYKIPIGGDVILEIEGKKIFEYGDVSLALRPLKLGDTIQLKVFRKGKIKEYEIAF